jgi:tetratricopeptide (TPR) repeat protein
MITVTLSLLAILLTIRYQRRDQRREKKRQWMEGRQYYRKAKAAVKRAEKEPSADEEDALEAEDYYEEAIGFCDDAIYLGFKKVEVYCLKANACQKLYRNKEALEAFQSAVKCDGSSLKARYGLARIYVDLQKDEQARHEFKHVLRLKPKDEKERIQHGYAEDWLESL